jgi:hypothetical protein
MPALDARSCRGRAATRRALLPLALVSVGTLLGAPATGAHAADPGAVFAVTPAGGAAGAPYLRLHANPGATLRRTVRITNTGRRPGTARLYAVDATTGRTTGAVYHGRSHVRRDVGAWTRIDTGRVRLAPRRSRTVVLTVRVPRSARDGQHLGGIVAENATLTRGATRRRGRGSFRVDVRSLTIMAVQVDLPGPRRERLAITGVRAGEAGGVQTLEVGMRNAGNRLVKGRGTVTVRGEHSSVLRRAAFAVDTFVPRTAVADPVVVPRAALPAGTYAADIVLHYGHRRTARLTAPLTISRRQVEQVFGPGAQRAPAAVASAGIPVLWLALGAVALVIAAFAAALAVMRRRERRHSA